MSVWEAYPPDYRKREVQTILAAQRAGECVSVVGLSGSGKSNLLGFLAHRMSGKNTNPGMTLVDCNRLSELTAPALFRLMRSSLGEGTQVQDEISALEEAITHKLSQVPALSLLLDRFDAPAQEADPVIHSNLRALRDTHKYTLTYVTATRRPLDAHTELAELFFANTLWLGALNESDARWNVERYATRKGLVWDREVTEKIIESSGGYPSLLRAVCEAHAAGATLELEVLSEHPAVRLRIEEFWADNPSEQHLKSSGLSDHPLLFSGRSPLSLDTTQFTAKEHLLWEYLISHPEVVCEKDDLIRAVWPEDKIYEVGVRDDSLAQLVRRLREKVEPYPSDPRYILTVPGRGYLFQLS